MRHIQIRDDFDGSDYEINTSQRLVTAMANRGFICGLSEARILWQKYSDSMYAGWMMLPSNEDRDIVACVAPYFDVLGEPDA